MMQQAFIEKRGRMLIGREEEIKAMMNFVTNLDEEKEKCLFIIAEPGMGKSSLVANYVLKLNEVRLFIFCLIALLGFLIIQRKFFYLRRKTLKNDTSFNQDQKIRFKKQPTKVCSTKNAGLKDFSIFTGKHLLESLFDKVAGLQTSNFIKKRVHQHKYISVSIFEIFKNICFEEHLRMAASAVHEIRYMASF